MVQTAPVANPAFPTASPSLAKFATTGPPKLPTTGSRRQNSDQPNSGQGPFSTIHPRLVASGQACRSPDSFGWKCRTLRRESRSGRPSGVAARPTRTRPRNQKAFTHSPRNDRPTGFRGRPRHIARTMAEAAVATHPLGKGCRVQANDSATEDQQRSGSGPGESLLKIL